MEIEGFNEVLSVVRLAKNLRDMGRADTVTKCFHDVIDYDGYWDSMYALLESVFSGYDTSYNADGDEEVMVFTDNVISEYYVSAWEYGKRHRIPHNLNPLVTAAEHEARKHLGYCYSMSWRLCGYTKTRAAARRSKLIVYSTCDSCALDQLAYSLLRLYAWFKNQCEELENRTEVLAA